MVETPLPPLKEGEGGGRVSTPPPISRVLKTIAGLTIYIDSLFQFKNQLKHNIAIYFLLSLLCSSEDASCFAFKLTLSVTVSLRFEPGLSKLIQKILVALTLTSNHAQHLTLRRSAQHFDPQLSNHV